MFIDTDLLIVMLIRIAFLFAGGGYLFYKWAKAPRRYFSDFPFLMGISFSALGASKVFDIVLYSMFLDVNYANLAVWDERLVFGYVRWLMMLVVSAPLLYANLKVWAADHPRLRLFLVGAHTVGFAILILLSQSFAALNALTSWLILPLALITILTFLFIYKQKRLPNVHGLLVGMGWLGYVFSSYIRPTLMRVGNPPWGLVIIAELLDLVMWVIIFFGFVLKPKFARQKSMPVRVQGGEMEAPVPSTSPQSNF